MSGLFFLFAVHAARGAHQREDETPKAMDAPSRLVVPLDKHRNLHIVRPEMLLTPLPVRAEVLRDSAAAKGGDLEAVVSQRLLSSPDIRACRQASHPPRLLHSGSYAF